MTDTLSKGDTKFMVRPGLIFSHVFGCVFVVVIGVTIRKQLMKHVVCGDNLLDLVFQGGLPAAAE